MNTCISCGQRILQTGSRFSDPRWVHWVGPRYKKCDNPRPKEEQ